jgi:hypothetical protein
MALKGFPLPISVDVPLRERRSYLHSTNLFDFLVARTGATHDLSLVFRRKIECEAEAIAMPEGGGAEYPALFSGRSGQARVSLAIMEKTPLRPMLRREPYNEDAVAGGSLISGKEIVSETGNGASAIERIVSLNKRLLTHEIDGRKTLVFSRLHLKSLPDAAARLRILLKSRLGLTLFRSAILSNDTEIGEIVFYGT